MRLHISPNLRYMIETVLIKPIRMPTFISRLNKMTINGFYIIPKLKTRQIMSIKKKKKKKKFCLSPTASNLILSYQFVFSHQTVTLSYFTHSYKTEERKQVQWNGCNQNWRSNKSLRHKAPYRISIRFISNKSSP